MASFDVLRTYLEARATFTEHELAFVRQRFVPRTLRAGEFLRRPGEIATHAAFVATGCMRSYVIDAMGKEHIVQFAPETWWLADTASLMTGAPSQYFVDAVEAASRLCGGWTEKARGPIPSSKGGGMGKAWLITSPIHYFPLSSS